MAPWKPTEKPRRRAEAVSVAPAPSPAAAGGVMPQRQEESCPECSIRVSFEQVRGDSKEPARVRSKKAKQGWESKGQVRQSESGC